MASVFARIGRTSGSVRRPSVGRWGVVVTTLVIAAMAASCTTGRTGRPAKPAPLRVAAPTYPGSAAIYVAKEKGFFADERLEVTLQPYLSGREALDAALSGKADLATSAETPIARAVVRGGRLSIVATLCEVESGAFIIARSDRGIRRAEDLAGKRVGVISGSSGDFFLHIYLVSSGVDPASVKVVRLPPAGLVAALAAGQVDAVSARAPFSVQAEQRLGAGAVMLDEPGLYTMFWSLSGDAVFVGEHTGEVARFLRALARANKFIASNPQEAQAITARHTGLDLLAVKSRWKDYDWVTRLDETLLLELEDEARWLSAEKQDVPDFLNYVDSRPLRRADPRDVTILE